MKRKRKIFLKKECFCSSLALFLLLLMLLVDVFNIRRDLIVVAPSFRSSPHLRLQYGIQLVFVVSSAKTVRHLNAMTTLIKTETDTQIILYSHTLLVYTRGKRRQCPKWFQITVLFILLCVSLRSFAESLPFFYNTSKVLNISAI